MPCTRLTINGRWCSAKKCFFSDENCKTNNFLKFDFFFRNYSRARIFRLWKIFKFVLKHYENLLGTIGHLLEFFITTCNIGSSIFYLISIKNFFALKSILSLVVCPSIGTQTSSIQYGPYCPRTVH